MFYTFKFWIQMSRRSKVKGRRAPTDHMNMPIKTVHRPPTAGPVTPDLYAPLPQIFSQANTPLKRWLLNFAAKRKGAEVSSGVIRSDSVWDKVFFSKIQVRLLYNQRPPGGQERGGSFNT